MASGKVPDPGNRPNRPVGWYGWWWIWLVFIVIAAFWFAGWGWWGYGGWWWGGRERVAIVQPTGPGLAVLYATNRQTYVRQPFSVTGVTVQNKVNNRAYWIDTGSAAPMLVATTAKDLNANASGRIHTGAFIAVTGTVEKPPAEAQVEKDWGLNQNQASRVEKQGAYVQASMIERAGISPYAGTVR